MSGIPAHLMTPLREVLADCEQFETNRGLCNLFTDARIRPWRDNLPQADTLMGRVDGVISYLHDKKHSDGSNALVLMLLALASTVDQQDDRYERLKALASALDESAPNSSKMTMAAQPTHDPGSRDVADQSKPLNTKTFTASPARTLDSQDSTKTGNVDFFISYNRHDKQWAEWIAWQLENAGYTTIIQAWDFRPGANFVTDMQQAAMNSERTIAVLSQDYLASKFTQPEWSAAFARDPTGKEGLLLPVKVRECDLKGLLPQIVYIDLTDLSSEQAAEELLAGVKRGRAKPLIEPKFPRATAPEFPDNL